MEKLIALNRIYFVKQKNYRLLRNFKEELLGSEIIGQDFLEKQIWNAEVKCGTELLPLVTCMSAWNKLVENLMKK